MSDVLIKGMDMPEGCYYCPILIGKANCICTITGTKIRIEKVREELEEERLPDCPLVELPEHGRLVDADALVKYVKDVYCKNCKRTKPVMCRACNIDDMLDELEEAPIVLEASEVTE